jgi:hypothetical protein
MTENADPHGRSKQFDDHDQNQEKPSLSRNTLKTKKNRKPSIPMISGAPAK